MEARGKLFCSFPRSCGRALRAHSSGSFHRLFVAAESWRHYDFGFPSRRVVGSRIVGPFSVSLCARWTNRSQMASATEGSPIAACHAVGGNCCAFHAS